MTAVATKFAALAVVAVGIAWGVSQVLESLSVAAHALGA